MVQKRDSIDRMRIASPCEMAWEGMKGNDRARYCDLCSLNVYNISEMTSKEVASLIAKSEGRVCARLFRRADGTVLTRDCPVGLRAIRRRVSRVAGAVITAIFSFCVSVMGQKSAQEDKSCPTNAKVTIERMQDDRAMLKGVILDINGAVLPEVKITITNLATKKSLETITNDDGQFRFTVLEAGKYDLHIETTSYLPVDVKQVNVETSKSANVEIQMTYEGTITVGILLLDPLVDDGGPGLKKTTDQKKITSLPF